MASKHVKHLITVGLLGGLLTAVTAAHAHYPWLLSSHYAPNQDRSITAYVGWGHAFPLEGFLGVDRVASVELVGPDGKKKALESNGSLGYATPALGQKGNYALLATQSSSYFTRTSQGNRRQSKEGLDGVISCSYSSNNMKALISVGGGDEQIGKQHGQVLEIVPLNNPANLRVGEYLDVQVLVRDEPYEGMVFATYGDFSSDGAYAYTVEADNEGKASIRILHPGNWLVRTTVRQPYPDSDVCDIESYTTTMTFSIR